MIYDLFTFNGEYDLLEIRFNILSPFVDKFVLCESMETFSGRPKPLYWTERNKDRFEEWEDKVIHIVPVYGEDKEIMSMMEGRPYVDQPAFQRAFYQKESLRNGLKEAQDEDVVVYGDADEIINPELLKLIEKNLDDQVYKLRQLAYSYYLNNRSPEDWRGTIITKYKNLKNGSLNDMRANPVNILEKGGWHFTNIGGLEAVKNKLESYDHQEVNLPWIKDGLQERIELNVDFLGRGYQMWKDESQLPQYILENKERYRKIWKS